MKQISYNPTPSRFGNKKALDYWMWCRKKAKAYIFRNPKPDQRYIFNISTVNTANHTVEGSSREIRLTDEQYAYLLTEHLFDSDFTCNKLLHYNAPFAAWLNRQIYLDLPSRPFVITCFSAKCDAEDIRRPLYVDGYFGYVANGGYVYRPALLVMGDEMTVSLYECTETGHNFCRRTEAVCDIDAKAVRRIIGGKTYQQMFRRIQERFQGTTAYEDFLALLRENGIIES